MSLKKYIVSVLTAFFFFSSLIPLNVVNAATEDPYYEAIIERGTLIVGLSPDYAPYEFYA